MPGRRVRAAGVNPKLRQGAQGLQIARQINASQGGGAVCLARLGQRSGGGLADRSAAARGGFGQDGGHRIGGQGAALKLAAQLDGAGCMGGALLIEPRNGLGLGLRERGGGIGPAHQIAGFGFGQCARIGGEIRRGGRGAIMRGQPAGYITAQLRAYAAAPTVHVWDMPDWLIKPAAAPADARNDTAARTFMIGIARSVNADEAAAAATWYAARKPAAGRAAAPEFAAQGKALFERGLPAQGVLPCGDCHGAQAQGMADFPRLAGQHAGYLERQLQAFAAGSRGHATAMAGQAWPLDALQIQSISAYLEGLP